MAMISGAGRSRTWRSGYSTVYRAFDAEGRLLYVGLTYDHFMRMGQHGGAAWTVHTRRIEFEFYPTREEAAAAESEAIVNEDPVWNMAGRPIRRFMQWMMAYPNGNPDTVVLPHDRPGYVPPRIP